MKKLLYKFLGIFFNKYNMKAPYPKNGPWIIKGNILLYNGGNKAYKKWIVSGYLHSIIGQRLPVTWRINGINDVNTFFSFKPTKSDRKMCERKVLALGFTKTPDEEVYEKEYEVICHNPEEFNKLLLEAQNIVKELTWQK